MKIKTAKCSDASLKKDEIKAVKGKMKKGDIILVGQLKIPTCLLFGDVATHSAIVIDDADVIHQSTSDVVKEPIGDFLECYDSAIIVRPSVNIQIKEKAIELAKKKVNTNQIWGSRGVKTTCAGFIDGLYEEAGKDIFNGLLVDNFIKSGKVIYQSDLVDITDDGRLQVKTGRKGCQPMKFLQDFLEGKEASN